MAQGAERAEILAQVNGVLRDHGIAPGVSSLNAEDSMRVRDMALGIIRGDIDREELLALSDELADQVMLAVQHLMAMRSAQPILELEERNPYYSAFQPRIIRDGPVREGK